LVLILSCILILCSCGKKPDQTVQESEAEEETNEEAEEEAAESDIDWTFIEETYTDKEGYIYNVEVKISPWMLQSSNNDMIVSAWDEVGKGNILPDDMDSWGLEVSSTGVGRQVSNGNSTASFVVDMNDMYYCVGYIRMINATEGFSFSEQNPGSLNPRLMWKMEGRNSLEVSDSAARSIGRTYYGGGAKDTSGVMIYANMTSDKWGVPFAIMAPENLTPNNPDGAYLEKMINGYFELYPLDETLHFTVGIYGKDGVYYEPAN